MREWADFTAAESEDGAVTLALTGPLTVSSIGVLDRQLRGFAKPVTAIDLAQVNEIDTVGAWLAWRTARDHGASIVGADRKAQRLIEAVGHSNSEAEIHPLRVPLFQRVPEAIGRLLSEWGAGTVAVVGFVGSVLASCAYLLFHPSRFRSKALVRQVELVGISALGIVGLMCFLVGIVITQLGAEQLADYGLDGFTVNLTGRLSMRELGVLMTAIMVAGRSGSAFAAQIGTMKLTEEIDAMRTIGVSPMEALIVPRVLATVIMMPLLGFYASVVAVIGGAAISHLVLDVPFFTFLTQLQEVVPMKDVWVGLIKAPFFGLIIAIAGCYQGLQVKANSEEIGLRTTMAVVQAIFMVIVLDAFFAVFFSAIGWG